MPPKPVKTMKKTIGKKSNAKRPAAARGRGDRFITAADWRAFPDRRGRVPNFENAPQIPISYLSQFMQLSVEEIREMLEGTASSSGSKVVLFDRLVQNGLVQPQKVARKSIPKSGRKTTKDPSPESDSSDADSSTGSSASSSTGSSTDSSDGPVQPQKVARKSIPKSGKTTRKDPFSDLDSSDDDASTDSSSDDSDSSLREQLIKGLAKGKRASWPESSTKVPKTKSKKVPSSQVDLDPAAGNTFYSSTPRGKARGKGRKGPRAERDMRVMVELEETSDDDLDLDANDVEATDEDDVETTSTTDEDDVETTDEGGTNDDTDDETEDDDPNTGSGGPTRATGGRKPATPPKRPSAPGKSSKAPAKGGQAKRGAGKGVKAPTKRAQGPVTPPNRSPTPTSPPRVPRKPSRAPTRRRRRSFNGWTRLGDQIIPPNRSPIDGELVPIIPPNRWRSLKRYSPASTSPSRVTKAPGRGGRATRSSGRRTKTRVEATTSPVSGQKGPMGSEFGTQESLPSNLQPLAHVSSFHYTNPQMSYFHQVCCL